MLELDHLATSERRLRADLAVLIERGLALAEGDGYLRIEGWGRHIEEHQDTDDGLEEDDESTAQFPLPNGMWACRSCNAINDADMRTCSVCFESK